MQSYVFDLAFVRGAWQRDVRVLVEKGIILAVDPSSNHADAEHIAGAAIPAMANIHSHAFQRGFAGLGERKPLGQSDFWAWREAMYRFSAAMTPELLHAVASQLYVECLEGGYSHITEFHYLHKSDVGLELAMADALFAAADDVGVGLTMLPVLYNRGGFENEPLNTAQATFHLSGARMQGLLGDLSKSLGAKHALGLAFHSLRAVDLASMQQALQWVDKDAPIHIHCAEQTKEVEDCLAVYGETPVAWLLNHMGVDDRWSLIHATHVNETELQAIAACGATVGICPTTEANLGDGIFPLEAFLALEGKIAIGSDSNICRSATEELRLLEYSQRLAHQRRTIGLVKGYESIGEGLWHDSALHGHKAVASGAGDIAVGKRADILVLDTSHPALTGKPSAALLDSFVFASDAKAIAHMMVAGEWVLQAGSHEKADTIRENFQKAMRVLTS